MKYTMYQEESSTVTSEKYDQMRQTLLQELPKKKSEEFQLRKLQFLGTGSDSIPNFFLCVKNQDKDQIYLEKKYIQNRIYYKRCTRLTMGEYQKIYTGDLEWMKGHRNPLLADFYLQVTLNHLCPGYLTRSDREMIPCKKGGHVTFLKKIERAAGSRTGLFDEPYTWISCLNEGKVLINYKKVVTLPGVISNMLQSGDEMSEDLGFVF
mgnify:CR=1 FL=1